jgi:hypothetical protein
MIVLSLIAQFGNATVEESFDFPTCFSGEATDILLHGSLSRGYGGEQMEQSQGQLRSQSD